MDIFFFFTTKVDVVYCNCIVLSYSKGETKFGGGWKGGLGEMGGCMVFFFFFFN